MLGSHLSTKVVTCLLYSANQLILATYVLSLSSRTLPDTEFTSCTPPHFSPHSIVAHILITIMSLFPLRHLKRSLNFSSYYVRIFSFFLSAIVLQRLKNSKQIFKTSLKFKLISLSGLFSYVVFLYEAAWTILIPVLILFVFLRSKHVIFLVLIPVSSVKYFTTTTGGNLYDVMHRLRQFLKRNCQIILYAGNRRTLMTLSIEYPITHDRN